MNAKENELAYKYLEEANACCRNEPQKAKTLMEAYHLLVQAAAVRATIEKP